MDNIFALNNQVFGSSFRERRVSSRTRRAMRSELIIPDSAVEMTYSDMCLVNGGAISVGAMATIIDVAIIALSFVVGVVTTVSATFKMAKISKGLVGNLLKKGAKAALVNMIKNPYVQMSLGLTSLAVSFGLSLVDTVFNFTLGGFFADLIDRADGNYNGLCLG